MPVAMSDIYYCEVCKSKVDWNAKSCPVCGVSFSGVLCPKCKKIGSSREFLNGCPRCGNADSGSFVGKAAGRTVARNRNREDRPWRSLLYWSLSALIIVIVGFIASYWFKN